MVTIRTFLVSVAVLLIIISTFFVGVPAQSENGSANGNGICGPMYIRNTPSELLRLSSCRVIEGSLQIALIEKEGITPESYQNLTFPLREITGYFLLYSAKGLQTLRHLFPNLTVIRGQEFIHNNYAFLVSETHELQEIGLPSLTSITGKVWIYNNQNLCYLDTINWAAITNDTQENGIKKNRVYEQCPNKCPDKCPKNEHGQSLCWSNEDCQKVKIKVCPDDDREATDCCSSQCLGDCTGPSPNECFVCKHVEYNGKCVSECPAKTYKYLNRRCVSEEECSAMNFSDPSNKKRLMGKTLEDKECVLECPKSYEEVVKNGVLTCKKCEGPCKKICQGLMVDSVESSQSLKGCTRIQGSLKIQIRGYTKNLAAELQANFDMIEEIDDYLVVAYTYSLSSLNFFKSLKSINGNKLEEQNYALVVKSNDNIGSLWNTTVKITNKKARVLFHYNPKLCPQKIRDFVQSSGILPHKDARVDIGVTNGDKVPCNQKKLSVRIKKMSNSSVTIVWENFLRNLTEPSHLLNYEVSYKEAAKNVSPYDDRDPCGQDDWKVMDVPKMHYVGSAGKEEPQWEEEKLISNLKYFTRYALYVKTVVIPDENSPNNNTGAESDVLYFVTMPDEPSVPQNLIVSSNSSAEILVSWYPPRSPNGELEVYEIYIKSTDEDVNFQDQRDYCTDGRPETKVPSISEQSTTKSFIGQIVVPPSPPNSENCCSCSSGGGGGTTPARKPNIIDIVNQDTDIEYAIVNKVFIANPDATFPEEVPASQSRRRRRRSSGGGVGESSTDSDEDVITFPASIVRPAHETYGRRPGSDFNLTHRQNVSLDPAHPVKRYEFLLKNLTHFRTYTIGVVACRKKTVEIENDTRICSEMVTQHVKTKASPMADTINPNSMSLNVTGQSFRLRWEEPPNPNGVVLAYYIQVKRVDSSKTNDALYLKCISRKHFQEGKNNYTFPDKLHPGNYSYSIRTVSLAAQHSNFTVEKFFTIEDGGNAWPFWMWLVIFVPILVVCGAICISLYWVKTKTATFRSNYITSANPEYMQNVDIPDEWEVPRDKLELLQELLVGQGSFGEVYEGILKDFIAGFPRLRCAVKTVSKDAPSEDRARFLQEALIMTQLNCHHVVKLLGVISKSQPTYVIMELMPRGDLKKYLRSRRPDSEYNSSGELPPTVAQILRMAAEIADGMAYLDSHRLVHRDLAARNCMVDEDLTVKVGDFGMTKDVFESEYYRKASRGLLPVRWMAPESLRDGMFSSKSDSWSYGVVLWEMATLAAQPYQGLTNDQVLTFVKAGGVMERPTECPSTLYDLMVRCWQYETRNRPTFAEILEWLTPGLDPSFRELSFYHSPKGVEYQAMSAQRQAEAEEVIVTAKTPLRATCDSDDDLDVTDDFESDEQDHDIIHSPYNCDNESGTLLADRTGNGGLPRIRYSASGGSGLPNSINSLSSSGGGGSIHFPTPPSQTATLPQAIPLTNKNNSRIPSQSQSHSPLSNNAFVSVNLGDPLTSSHPLRSGSYSNNNNNTRSVGFGGGRSGGGLGDIVEQNHRSSSPSAAVKFPQNNSSHNTSSSNNNPAMKSDYVRSAPLATRNNSTQQNSVSSAAAPNNKNPTPSTIPTIASAVNNPQNFCTLNNVDSGNNKGLSILYPSSDSAPTAPKVSNGVVPGAGNNGGIGSGSTAPTTTGNNAVSPTGSQGNSGGNGYITLRHSPVTENYPKNKTTQF